jgi:hypothetical protein
MLNEIPEQFVEGINEAAEQSYEDTLVITEFVGTGIYYNPSVSYLLTRLEMMLTFGDIPPDGKLDVHVSSDYGLKPSDIELSSASLVPKKLQADWNEIRVEPVSLVKGRSYWLIINPNRCRTALIKARKGSESTFCVKRAEKWTEAPDEFKHGSVMVRFYGKILPVS